MTYEQIETFLAVVTHGTISAAAEELFVSQSTVSGRIQQLEAELGVSLFIREKGHRNVELTAHGQSFVSLAGMWTQLWDATLNLKETPEIQHLNIASIDSVNNCTFVPLFNRLIDKYPNLKLHIHTHHSNEINNLVENHTADIGYVFSQNSYSDIISRPVYRELMYLVTHKDSSYGNGISCEELDPAEEIYLRWGQDYQNWHDSHWPRNRYALVSVNTGSTLQRFLNRPQRWAIAPRSVIHEISKGTDLVYYTLKDPPPPRICYELVSRYTSETKRKLIEIFRRELEKYIMLDEDICTFESWMLEN